MSSEDLMFDSDALMIEMHAANVKQIYDTTALRTEAEQTKLLASVGLTARRMHAILAAKRRAQAQIAADARAIKASTMKALAANENKAAAQEEQEMDDDSGRTPERMAQLHADIRQRLEAARSARESKQLAGRGVGAADSPLPRGVEAEGGAPAPVG
jgi:Asp-tRNA(Asn)/Glu-tRNA(Gln) amidotransferase B subunit